MFIAQYTDAVIRAKLLGDAAAADFVLRKVPDSPLVQAAEWLMACSMLCIGSLSGVVVTTVLAVCWQC